MTSLQSLLAELAPSGVPHLRLGDVAALGSARVPDGVLNATTYVGVDNLLPNFGGRRDAGYGVNSSGAIAFDVGDILIGNIRPYLKKVWLSDRLGGASPDVLVVSIDRAHRDSILPRFLYLALASERFIDYSMKHAKGAKMPRGSKAATLDYRVPVPPPEIQREIVRVLDHFTELEAQLKGELETRTSQLNHFRNTLVDGLIDDGVEHLAIGSLAGHGFFSDGDWVESKDQDPEGDVRLTQLADVGVGVFRDRSNRRMRTDQAMRLSCTFLKPGDILIARMPEPLGRACQVPYGIGKAVSVVDVAILRSEHPEVLPRYVMHALNSAFVHIQMLSFQAGGTRQRISRSNLANVRLPMPAMEVQSEIASFLDKLDALVNDQSIGLPAELAARRKQYEYYRDKLLTFEEAPA